MTPREFGSFTIWMLVVTGATHSAYAQNNSLHGPAMEVTPFMSHDSTFRWRIGAAISYAWTSRLNVETEIDSSTGINQVKGEELGASVNLLYSLRGADRVRPYVAGGAGVEQYSTSYWCACDDALERGIIIEESSRAAALNAGGGVKIRIGENLSFRADARWLNGLARGRTLYGFWRDMRQHWRVYSGVTFGLGHRTTPSGSWK